MSAKNQRKSLHIALLVTALLLAAILIYPIACKKADEPAQNQPSSAKSEKSDDNPKPEASDQIPETSNEKLQTSDEPTLTLQQIAAHAQSWRPGFNPSFGKTAPDFTLTDINGKKHSITNYKGKNVILVFWATWCPPCRIEIPHLIELRNSISKEKLGMLAISYEPEQKVKSFSQTNKLNYTVATISNNLPAPFGSVTSIPTSFFIDKNGKIKFATVGSLDLETMKNILKAEK